MLFKLLLSINAKKDARLVPCSYCCVKMRVYWNQIKNWSFITSIFSLLNSWNSKRRNASARSIFVLNCIFSKFASLILRIIPIFLLLSVVNRCNVPTMLTTSCERCRTPCACKWLLTLVILMLYQATEKDFPQPGQILCFTIFFIGPGVLDFLMLF